MNRALSEAQIDTYLNFTREALLSARAALQVGATEQAHDLVDMLHNLPTFLQGSAEPWFKAWNEKSYEKLFVAPMRAKYPELGFVWDSLPRAE